jgi:hypothetical protein
MTSLVLARVALLSAESSHRAACSADFSGVDAATGEPPTGPNGDREADLIQVCPTASAAPAGRCPLRGRIAAPTAAVLYQFRELCIAGRATRVAHFEQPLFARR